MCRANHPVHHLYGPTLNRPSERRRNGWRFAGRLISALGIVMLVLFATDKGTANNQTLVRVFDATRSMAPDCSQVWHLVLDAVAEKENWSIQYTSGTLTEGQARLADGRVDLLTGVPNLPCNPRQQVISQESVLSTWSQIYTHPSISVQSILDLNRHTVGIPEQNAQGVTARKMLDGLGLDIQLVEFKTGREMLAALDKRWIDAAVVDRLYSAVQLKHSQLIQTAILFPPTDYRFAARSALRERLLNPIDYHLRRMKADPTSAYHRHLNALFDNRTELRILGYLKLGLLVTAIGLLGAFVHVTILRHRIRSRTFELARRNTDLKAELKRRHKAEEAQADSECRLREMFDACRRSEEKYRLLVENAHDLIVVIQKQMITFANPSAQRVFGYAEADLRQIPFSSLIDPEDRQAVMGVQHPVNRKSPPSYPTVRAHTKRGERCWLQMHSVPIDWEGKPAELCLMRDVTTSKRMEAQLYQAQKIQAIGTLAGGVAHDFNNILAAILGNTELCKLKIAPENGLNHNLDQIFSAGQRAKALINQILTFSRQKEKDQQPIEIRYGIKEALKLLQATLPSTIEIRDNIHKQPSIVVADQTQIHQIVMNVCTNAAHAMQERGGILKIGLTNIDLTAPLAGTVAKLEPGAYAVITVTDNGIGMSPETRECIFDPYFTTKPQGKGTGLGLSMVHGIVRALGGSINVHSEPGVGSTFEIYLPRTGQPSVVAVSAQQPIPGGHERILLVDDEAMLVDMTSELLLQLGYQVVGRTSSLEALQVFRTDPQHFDLVVTDQTMPNMTGKELASRVMATRPDLPVVICTGFSQAIDEEEALSLGIRAFVKKPILRNELAAAVRFALDGCCEAVRAQA